MEIGELQDFCLTESRSVRAICKKFKITAKSLYNSLKTNTFKKLFIISKADGLIQILTNPLVYETPFVTKLPFKKAITRTYDKITGIRRAGPERWEAILKTNRVQSFGFYNKDLKKFEYTNTVFQENNSLFNQYKTRTYKEKIILTRSTDNNPANGIDIIIPYQTRFTSKGRQAEILTNFNEVWDFASSRHLQAVFLTLTSKPVPGLSLFQSNQMTHEAGKKFMKKLKYYFPYITDYIKVNEFQKNGRLHLHIVIFGINWLTTRKHLIKLWTSCAPNCGPVLFIRGLTRTKEGWTWARSAPADAQGMAPKDYLKTYLQKGLTGEMACMYWISGINSFSASKALRVDLKQLKKSQAEDPVKEPVKKSKRYFLKGIISSVTGFRSSHRKDSIAFFSGSLLKKPEVEKPKAAKQVKQKPLSLAFTTANKITQDYLNSSRR